MTLHADGVFGAENENENENENGYQDHGSHESDTENENENTKYPVDTDSAEIREAFAIWGDVYYTGDAKDYDHALLHVKDFSNYSDLSVSNLKMKIRYFAGKSSTINVNKFLEKGEMVLCLKELLLSKLTDDDLRILLTNEMKSQKIEDNNIENSSAYISYADVIADCDRQSMIDILLKSSNR